MKRLYRSNNNKILSGLLGGLGEYFNLDPVFIRFIFVIMLIFSRVLPMVVIYLIGLALIPRAPDIEILHTKDTEGSV
jgi:phage shock protein C